MWAEKNFCYGKMTSSQKMSKAWKPVLRKEVARHGRYQIMLVKCMPREGKTKTWLTESGHVLMLLPERRKWLMAGYKHPRSSAKNKWRRFQLYKWWDWVEICTATPTVYFKPLSALPSNVTVSLISNHFKIMKMCSLSAPLVKTQNRSAMGRNKRYRQDGLAMPVKHILLCKVFRHYQSLERLWVLRSESKHCILPPSIWYSSLSILLSPWDYWLETDIVDHFWDLRFHYSATTLTNYKCFAKYPMFSLAESPHLMGW